jgi:PAS domain S-box-containing protein
MIQDKKRDRFKKTSMKSLLQPARLRVLLVEDDPDDVRLIQEMLWEDANTLIDLECAGHLNGGLEKLDNGGIDAVLVDLNLPDSQGLDNVIKIQEKAEHLPILVLTGLDDDEICTRAVFEGAQDFLIKGDVDAKTLLRAIHHSIERKRVEESFRASESRFRKVTEKNADAILVVDRRKIIRFANPAAEALFGMKKEELLGQRFRYGLKKTETAEIRIDHTDEESAVAEMRIVDFEWEGESAYLVSLRDITERMRMEEALKASEEKLKIILENVKDVIFQVSPDGLLQYVNPAVEKVYGYKPKELVGKGFRKITPSAEMPKVMRALRNVQSGKDIQNFEIDQIDDHGKPVTMEVNAVPIRREGKIVTVQGVMRNITERKQAEQALRDSLEKLRRLDELKSNFLSSVSHELRTPIAIMREGVSLCLDGIAGSVTETQQELLTHSLESIDRLAHLISDLLDVSNIESGKFRLKRSSLDVCKIVHEVMNLYHQEAREKGITFKEKLPGKPVKLFADKDKVSQILKNLISNAIRFTNSGGKITIGVLERKDVIECRVADTGIGIAEKNIPSLFSKFEQFGRTDGPGYQGTGLGLTIAKGLVQKHGGKIWVESELNEGTTFWFTLEKVLFPKILIIDDEKTIVELMKRILKADKYRFAEAFDGESAIQIAKKEPISLIILDMVLPGMSGYEVIGRLKEDVRTADIPILISSGYDVDEGRLNKINREGAIPIIQKPLRADELKKKVKKMMMGE